MDLYHPKPLAMSRAISNQDRLLRGSSNLALNVSRDGAFTTPGGTLLWCFTTLTAKKINKFLVSCLNVPFFSLKQLSMKWLNKCECIFIIMKIWKVYFICLTKPTSKITMKFLCCEIEGLHFSPKMFYCHKINIFAQTVLQTPVNHRTKSNLIFLFLHYKLEYTSMFQHW